MATKISEATAKSRDWSTSVAAMLRLGAIVGVLWLAACADPIESPRQQQAGEPGTEKSPEIVDESPGASVEIDAPDAAALAAQIEALAIKVERPGPGRAKALGQVDEGRKVVEELTSDTKLLFYKLDGNLTSDGEAVLALLGDVERHGLVPRSYHFDRVDAATAHVIEAFEGERVAKLAAASSASGAHFVAAAVQWLRTGKGSQVELERAGLTSLSARDRAQVAGKLDAIAAAVRTSRAAVWAADVEVTRAVVRYIVDFTMARPLHPHEPTSAATIRKLADKRADEILGRLQGKRGAIAKAMRAAWPTQPQYAALLDAADRYAKIAATSPWEPLPKIASGKLERGARGPVVSALATRLRVEGYEVGSGDTIDQPFVDAILRFQANHQLSEDGVVAPGTVRELDVSAAARLQQIRLALGRWRESNARDPEDFYIWVDIAGQRVQVYEHGKAIREHRVIVGKDEEDIDYEKRIKGRINRTKIFTAKMTKITLAPRWYPTPRVIDLELGPALAKDPDYYEKHGYVSEMNGDGAETVYQRSGSSNLLGAVKFQFPNKHAIYMHDTPSKAIFKRARRAYSHGCVRLENPLALANFLLGRDRGWTKQKIKKIIDDREESVVGLKTAIPVYLDYVTVTVDDGVVRFWHDVYDYDRAALTGAVPVEEVEDYKPASTRGLL